MYGLYVNDKLAGVSDDLKTLKNMMFVLAVKGHKVAYRKL